MTETGISYGGDLEQAIYLIRGCRVLMDADLARLYGVTTGNLNKAVRRNASRFPSDFMFQLTKEEHTALRFQIGSLERGRHSKYLPCAFTEQGVAMLSSVLGSERAVQVNIAIMRAFVRTREAAVTHKQLGNKLDELERHVTTHDAQIKTLFDAIRQLVNPPLVPKKQIGFHVKEARAKYGSKHR